ncbi:MAG: hypothetical protein PVJ02_02655 [Gemmatimonadota bacterium]|jgi:hypothetical protein
MPSRRPTPRTLVAAAALLGVAACAPSRPAVVAPAVDPQQLALALEERTALEEPIRVVFAWQLNEAGVRVKGRGVARIEPPYKARLDLFLGNGETVVRAALVDGDLRLPPGAPKNILPPPDLMWGVLGVFRPQMGIELLGADRLEGGATQLRYRYADGRELDFRVTDGRMTALELLQGGHAVERVELGLDDGSRYPAEATYRNLAAFRELKLTRESVERVESYPPDIWDPSAQGVHP